MSEFRGWCSFRVAGALFGVDVDRVQEVVRNVAVTRVPPGPPGAVANRRRRVVVRKGRENYLCLLNLEDALQGGFAGRAAILAANAAGQGAGFAALVASAADMEVVGEAGTARLPEPMAVALRLDKLRADSEQKLDAMRATVEEKLQGTLEKRLGESFALVSDRLEMVHKGRTSQLGEQQRHALRSPPLKAVLAEATNG